MALRAIVSKKEDVLRKKCREVTAFDKNLATLLDDMKETMYKAEGVGLAGPQVGYLKRLFVFDVGEGYHEAINPVLSNFKGEQRDVEGCLSCPNEFGFVTRPLSCTLSAQDRHGNPYTLELSNLACRCACHEFDHLEGQLFIDIQDESVRPEDLDKVSKRHK